MDRIEITKNDQRGRLDCRPHSPASEKKGCNQRVATEKPQRRSQRCRWGIDGASDGGGARGSAGGSDEGSDGGSDEGSDEGSDGASDGGSDEGSAGASPHHPLDFTLDDIKTPPQIMTTRLKNKNGCDVGPPTPLAHFYSKGI
jgi:hypothetical protein